MSVGANETMRDPDVQSFVDHLRAAFAVSDRSPDAAALLDRVLRALERPAGRGAAAPARLPATSWLEEALTPIRRASPPLRDLGASLSALAPRLRWMRRGGPAPSANERYAEGHANAFIVGPGGLEEREDVWIGVSLLAPDVRYPDHSHAPEEVYLLLTPGSLRHGDEGWADLEIGSTFHNVPGIDHAMASGARPFLAVWCLAGETLPAT